MLYEVILDSGETPNKCTIAPLQSRADFRLYPVKGNHPLGPLQSPILLNHEGECLSVLRKSLTPVAGIASIDCIWRRLNTILRRVAAPMPVLARIPEGFRTAYPRRSSLESDPEAGLATIEAIFVASALLGNWDASLLANYYFGRKFVNLNANRFAELGVEQALRDDSMPVLLPRKRSSLQRRRDRGKRE